MNTRNSSMKSPGARESIGHRISVLHRYTRVYLDRELAKYDIGSSQIPFLMTLYHEDGVHQEMLTEIHNVDKATTTRAITKLEKKGYIVRKTDEADRRAYRVYLTVRAKRMRPVFRKILTGWTKILLIDFSEDERKTLVKLLDKLAINASEYND